MSYIRTRSMHTARDFTPYTGSSSGAHTNLLLNLSSLMSTSKKSHSPPGLGHADWRSSSSGVQPSYTRSRTRPRASAFSHTPRRSAAPPPPPTPRTMKFDPFADELADPFGPPPMPPSAGTHDPVLYRTPRTAPASLSANYAPSNQPSFTLHVSSQQRAADRDAKSKLVAGILLNRVHAVGKPMRRRSFDGTPREYVKSGLSSVISVGA